MENHQRLVKCITSGNGSHAQLGTSGNSFPLQSTDFTRERLECSGDLEYFYMSNSPTGTYPIAILCTHVHSIACISKKYNSENDTYDIYGCIASVEILLNPT